ncbi:MAG TPA: c-type cytochrome [Pseudogracilibacillus sp.]|nr:c-type cytochrome [Pseudogracilibacillus sp.]
MKFLLKERNVWLIFVLGLIIVVACAPKDENAGKLYNENDIRNKLEQLDSDSDILYGKEIFDNTKKTLPDNVGNELSCLSCHGNGGLNTNSPMVGITEKFPTMRRGEFTTLEDRVNGCFIRSMNGTELEEDSRELTAIIKYFEFISEDVESEDDITWRMTNDMEEVPEPNVADGAELYIKKNCISCHATDGSGTSNNTGPALWGDDSFNIAAGMGKIEKSAGFIKNNMPKDKPGTLTDQEAADLAAYILSQDRPDGDPEKVGDYHEDPDRTYLTQDRRDKIKDGDFDWKGLDTVK